MSTRESRQSGVAVQLAPDSLGRGAVFGGVSFLVGYLLTYVVTASRLNEGFADAFPAWKVVGWYYYNAHFVDLSSAVSVGVASATSTGSLIAAAESGTPELLYVVPPLALVVGGASLARQFGPPRDPIEGAKGGALVVVGYLLLALVGAFVTAHTVSTNVAIVEVSGTVQPKLLPAVLLAGLLYPLVFGAVGGALAAVLESR